EGSLGFRLLPEDLLRVLAEMRRTEPAREPLPVELDRIRDQIEPGDLLDSGSSLRRGEDLVEASNRRARHARVLQRGEPAPRRLRREELLQERHERLPFPDSSIVRNAP